MNINVQRDLAIKILKNKSRLFNLYTIYKKEIEDNQDFIDICSFLIPYLSKHRINYYEINLTTGDFKFNHYLINAVIRYLLSLKPYEFEKISTLIGKCFNYNETFATKKSRDQGIDFISSSEFLKDLNSFDIGLKQYIIGQAKKFKKGLVDINDIKNLYASIDMFTRRLFPSINKYKIYSNIELKKFTPIHPIFSTSYFFSNDALNVCQQADIITIDIIDLTLIITKGIDNLILDWKKGAISIDRKKANKQLRKIKII
jgi:hypothetical protein